MEKFYNTLFLDHSCRKRFISSLRGYFRDRSILCLTLLLFILTAAAPAGAQDATFFESFDDIELGELPEGWTRYQTGGTHPGSQWVVSKYGFFGPRVAWSNFGDAAETEGDADEDWLITPKITPAPGDYLIFDGAQEFVNDDYGSQLHILISTTTTNPAAFTTTLATYTETEFPDYLYSRKLVIDLSAYANTPVYIAFAHKNFSTDFEQAEDLYLDNIWVRPPQNTAYYTGEIYAEGGRPLRVGVSATHMLLGVKLVAVGDNGIVNASSFTFTSAGTTDPSKILEARLYSTGKVTYISSTEENGTVDAPLYGKVSNPGESFEITGTRDLLIGDNYFWLYFVLAPDYVPEFPYPHADATFEKVVVDGVEHAIPVSTTEEFVYIVPTHPVNDSLAHAAELSPGITHYGSYNFGATYENGYEQLSYCSPEGYYDVMNTLWWHFKAPGEGLITADLSGTSFNSVMVIQDKNYNQLACNDNIDTNAGVMQSRISDFPVTAGQDIYIRVSGVGGPGDPNGEAGIVILDFNFSTPLGTEEPGNRYRLSSPYPNPATGKTSFDITLSAPGEVIVDIQDMMGKPALSENKGFFSAGTVHTVDLDVSALPAGAYLVSVRGNNKSGIRKLMVVK